MRKTKKMIFVIFLLLFFIGCTKAQKLTSIAEFGGLKGEISPALQATITLYQNDTKILQANSDTQNGKFSMLELTPGVYNMTIAAPNYQNYQQDVTIFESQTNEIEIVLVPIPSKEPPESPPPIFQHPYSELVTNLVIVKDSFNQGEQITLTVTMTNPKEYPIHVGFSTGRWRPSFTLTDTNNNEIWYSQHHMGFICLWAEVNINPGETWTHTETWDGRDDHGNIIASGKYTLTAEGLGESRSSGQEIHIQPVDLSGFTGRIAIEFKNDVTKQEAQDILENQGFTDLDFSLFVILKHVYIIVPENEKTGIISQLKQNSKIVEAYPVSERE